MRKTIPFILVVFVLSGCAAGRQGYTQQQMTAMPEWKQLARMLYYYQRQTCPKCKPNDWKLGIIKNDKVNAASAGNGIFYVTTGVFLLPLDEQEAVIAHEVAHEVLGHPAKRQGASLATTGAFVILGAIIPGAGLLNHVVNPLVVATYSRSQELDADALGVKLLATRLGDKEAAETFKNLLLRVGGQGDGGLFANHPHPEERIAQIEAILRGEIEPGIPPPVPPRMYEAGGDVDGGEGNAPGDV